MQLFWLVLHVGFLVNSYYEPLSYFMISIYVLVLYRLIESQSETADYYMGNFVTIGIGRFKVTISVY